MAVTATASASKEAAVNCVAMTVTPPEQLRDAANARACGGGHVHI